MCLFAQTVKCIKVIYRTWLKPVYSSWANKA